MIAAEEEVSGEVDLRDRIAWAIYTEGAYCGDCGYEGWDTCRDCRESCLRYADATLALLDQRTKAAS